MTMNYQYQGVSAGGSVVTWQWATPDPSGLHAPEEVTNVVQTNQPIVAGGGGGGGGTGASWHTLLDLDFTACASQTFTADGVVTIGGANFTLVNVAQRSGTLYPAVSNGRGLSVTAINSNSSYLWYQCQWTMLMWDMPAVVKNGVPVRLAGRVSGATPPDEQNWNGSMLMLAYPNLAYSVYNRFAHGVTRVQSGKYGGYSGGVKIGSQMWSCAEHYDGYVGSDPWGGDLTFPVMDFSHDVFGIYCPNGIDPMVHRHACWGKQSAGQYTDLSGLSRFCWAPTSPVPAVLNTGNASDAILQANNWKLCILGTQNGMVADDRPWLQGVKFEAYY